MKAIAYFTYGSPDVLEYDEVDKPTPGDEEVLMRVRAASVNPYDWHFMRGSPWFLRIAAGLRKPRVQRLGVDVAGELEAVGRKATRFKPGDAVFGICHGAFAEYAITSESKVVPKPDNVTFEQAACVPVAGLTALQALRDKGQLRPGKKVLINGASGGVGTFAVQIARSLGGEVTGVCSTRNVEMVRSLGADSVTDYTQEDFIRSGLRYDLILDLVSNRSLRDYRRVLNPKGIYVGAGSASGVSMIDVLASFLGWPVLSRLGSRKFVTFLARPNKEDLSIIAKLLETGKVVPVIDRTYSLSEVPEAIRYLEEGHARGKVVIALEPGAELSVS